MTQVPVDTCLQCQQTREEVRINETICGIEEGYEYRELVAEWPRHHWRDWHDQELKYYGILPEFYSEHRRDPITYLSYAPCDHTIRGHSYAENDAYFGEYLLERKGQCGACGKMKPDDS